MNPTIPSGAKPADSNSNTTQPNTQVAGQQAAQQTADQPTGQVVKPNSDKVSDKVSEEYILSDADKFWSGELQIGIEPLKDQEYHNVKISTEEIIKRAPPELKRMLQNLRSDYTKKTQQVAEERKRYEALAKQISEEREVLKKMGEFEVNSNMNEEDIWSGKVSLAEYVAYMADQKAAERVSRVSKSLEQEKAVNAYREFKATRPEFSIDGFEDKVADYYEKGLSLDDAYLMAKTKLPVEEQPEIKDSYTEFLSRNNKETQQRELLSKMSASGRSAKGFVEIKKGTEPGEVRKLVDEYYKQTGLLPKIKRV